MVEATYAGIYVLKRSLFPIGFYFGHESAKNH